MSQKPHILYVDDEENNLVSFAATFRREFTVHTALDAPTGAQILDEQPIKVIVTDQRMPGVTGVEFLSSILEKHPDPIRMVLTGYSDVEAIISAINKGRVYRYITKPWDPEELRITLMRAVELYDLEAERRGLVTELKLANESLEQKVKDRTIEIELRMQEIAVANERVGELNRKLAHVNEERQEFLRITATDLRTPIRAIRKSAENVISTSVEKSVVAEARSIEENADKISSVLSRITLAGESNDTKVKLSPATFDIQMLTQPLLMEYQERAGRRNININFTTRGKIGFVHADIQATQDILDGMLSRVIAAAGDGEAIEFTISQEQHNFRADVRSSTGIVRQSTASAMETSVLSNLADSMGGRLEFGIATAENSAVFELKQ
jgi:two-component system, sensor histidine kinase and response regulator